MRGVTRRFEVSPTRRPIPVHWCLARLFAPRSLVTIENRYTVKDICVMIVHVYDISLRRLNVASKLLPN